MKLGVVMPLWRREMLTRLTLRRIAKEVEGDSDCILVAITDELRNGRQAREYGFHIVSVPNRPLSDKKNEGIRYLRGRVDGVVLLGSDDWATGLGGVSLLDRYRAALSESAFIGPLDMWYLDLETGGGGYSQGYRSETRQGEPIGVGRAMRAEVLDALGWTPRPKGLATNHDSGMRKMVEGAGFRCLGKKQEELGIRIVDIKSPSSVTPFSRLNLMPRSWPQILMSFPDDEVNDLVSLYRSSGTPPVEFDGPAPPRIIRSHGDRPRLRSVRPRPRQRGR